jgi:hypothetical protein
MTLRTEGADNFIYGLLHGIPLKSGTHLSPSFPAKLPIGSCCIPFATHLPRCILAKTGHLTIEKRFSHVIMARYCRKIAGNLAGNFPLSPNIFSSCGKVSFLW